MTPQFVDFNGDSHIDIVAATFGGSPRVAFGDGKSFAQPVNILDENGLRIAMNQYWDFDVKQWKTVDRHDPENYKPQGRGQLTSAWATDWDGDGDMDLLLGDYGPQGYVMLRRNKGTNTEPVFGSRNELVMCGDKPLSLGQPIGSLRTFDWNHDGLQDIVVTAIASKGQPDGSGSFVMVYLNESQGETLTFSKGVTLIPAVQIPKKVPFEFTRPFTGYYAELQDFDGDGDIDIIVGGRGELQPEERKLSAEEKLQLVEVRKAIKQAEAESKAIMDEIRESVKDLPRGERGRATRKALEDRSEELDPIRERIMEGYDQLEDLEPSIYGVASVWWFENLSQSKGGKAMLKNAK